jgi:hypothetical protein
MDRSKQRPPYCSYVLRCWLERGPDPAEPGRWRFSLEDPHTGRRRGFASLATLVTSLQADLSEAARGGTPTAGVSANRATPPQPWSAAHVSRQPGARKRDG